MNTTSVTTGISIDALVPSFLLSLEAEGRSPATLRTYTAALARFEAFLKERGMPVTIEGISREHIEAFLSELRRESKPATVQTYYAAVRRFFAWAVEEDEIQRSPTERIKMPEVPRTVMKFPTQDQLRALLKACEGTDYMARRDMAMTLFILDTGVRRSEAASLCVADLDLQSKTAVVTGKGSHSRRVAFGKKTARALDRYLRARARRDGSDHPRLWLGHRGPLSGQSINDALAKRAARAGIDGFHVHQLRHVFAHRWLAEGGQERDLMALAGWRSSSMLSRYGAASASERAVNAHRQFSPADSL